MTLKAKAIAIAAGCAFVAAPAAAEKANQLVDINGMDAGGAENALMSRGFTFVSSHNSDGGYTNSYWWDEGDDDCVAVEAYGGRIMTISDAADQDCGHHEGSNAAAAVGVAAGAAILGALLSHKSHHHDDGNHHSDRQAEALYDRGYTDGLHNAPYHNRDRSEEYATGYSAGVDERSGNLRHHSGRGGYHASVDFSDLQGARAAGAMSDIESRGFRQVDNFTSGDTRYSIQWNRDTSQCVQMTIAEGRIYDIRDIGTNPNCR